MSEQEYRDLHKAYLTDGTLHGFTKKIAEIYNRAVPIALGKEGFIYSSEVNKLLEKVRKMEREYICKNYSQLIDGN